MRKNLYLAAPLLFTAVIAGCASDKPAGETPPTATSNDPSRMTGSTAMQPPSTTSDTSSSNGTPTANGTGGTTNAGTSSPAAGMTSTGSTSDANAAATPLTDDQILEVVHTADTGELEQARLAQSKAQDPRVKGFATMMIKDHTAADRKAMTIAKNDKLNMSSSPTSTSLASDALSNTSSLQGQTGASFDKSYIDTQCKEHQAVLDLIDQTLMPDAKSSDVKDFLTAVRAKVAAHLQHAQDIQKSL
jgi:putative membrane protein